MAYTTPRTWVVGEVVTAALMNVHLRDNISFLANPPRCRLKTSSQPTNNNAWTAVAFTLEDWDTDNMHSTSTNTSRITATTAGIYQIHGIGQWAANATGQRFVGLSKNGSVTPNEGRVGGVAPAGTTVPALGITNDVSLSATNWVELMVFQDTGAALNIAVEGGAPVFVARWVSQI